MPPRGSFERRLLVALALFSLVPAVLLIWTGGYLLSEVLELRASGATFGPIAESGRTLLDLAEASDDPALAKAAAQHREVLSASLLQAGRWDYLIGRVLRVIPFVGVALAVVLTWLAVRAARGIARELARPINELVGWAGRIARGEPLPPLTAGEDARRGEFASLRRAFRAMEHELEISRVREIEAERARTWVTMARSVAHELKNSLTPLRLAARSLESNIGEAAAAREPLDVIASEAGRLDALARAFSQFGRLPEGPASDVDVVELLEHLMATHLPPQIERRLDAETNVPHVYGHHDVLSRAFANVLLNAAEAMGGASGEVAASVAQEDGAVRVRVRDSGPGIDAEDLPRIWDPDFTTKARGTGLGLALVRQSIHAHGGSVEIGNSPDGGAEITVRIPIAREEQTSEEAIASWPAS